jgi:sugar phosphate isomerase/epimerase
LDLSRVAVSHITTTKWDLPTALERYKAHGLGGFGPWRDKLQAFGFDAGLEAIKGSGLGVANYCAAGFFTMSETACQEAVDGAVEQAIAAMDEQKRLGAPCLVTVVGPVGCYTVDSAMDVIMDSLHRVAEAAEEREVDLGLEVLHPMDITTWSMVRTIHQGLDIIEEIDSPRLGIMLDLYNTWWDPDIKSGIVRAGNRIKGVHLADWRNPTRSFTDRTVPGKGIIPLADLISEVEETGWNGYYDVEIFSDELWESDYDLLLDDIVNWFQKLDI